MNVKEAIIVDHHQADDHPLDIAMYHTNEDVLDPHHPIVAIDTLIHPVVLVDHDGDMTTVKGYTIIIE